MAPKRKPAAGRPKSTCAAKSLEKRPSRSKKEHVEIIMHHLFTTIIYPRGGSRNKVTSVHKFLFFCLFNGLVIDLPDLMINLISLCKKQKGRSIPYAAHLTSIFEFMLLKLEDEICEELKEGDLYNIKSLQARMGYELDEHGNLVITLKKNKGKDKLASEIDGDSSEEEQQEQETNPQQEAQMETDEGPSSRATPSVK